MFIQVVQGKVTRKQELRRVSDEWRRDLAPGSIGWLGNTFGFTDDDLFIGVVRFESRQAAMANSGRPEQEEWSVRLRDSFDGPIEFHDCDDVVTFLDGGSDDAGFVQVIQGWVDDAERLKRMVASADAVLRETRPEIIGGTVGIEPDGTFTETVAFTSEEEARRGEQAEPPAELRGELEWAMRGARFFDLRQPWFESP